MVAALIVHYVAKWRNEKRKKKQQEEEQEEEAKPMSVANSGIEAEATLNV